MRDSICSWTRLWTVREAIGPAKDNRWTNWYWTNWTRWFKIVQRRAGWRRERGKEDGVLRRTPLLIAWAALMAFACGGTPAPAGNGGTTTTQANVGSVAFLSSQGQPAQEVQDMNSKVLAGFNGTAT